ncbi:MAG: DUF4347 domain-containing protein [Phormidesmis sp.]
MTTNVEPNAFKHFISTLPQEKHHLIVIDAELPQLNELMADVTPKCSVLVIERHQDAIALITQILALFAQGNITAESLIVLAHSRPSKILIGKEGITSQQLTARASEVTSWNVQEIQLFSCHAVMASQMIETLAELSGATVFTHEQTLTALDDN